MKKFALGFILLLVLCSMMVFLPEINIVKASGTIYIKADGSVDPITAPIQRDGNVYTFTGNISDSIVVERDDIVVDGAGYILQGTGANFSKGIDLTNRNNVTIKAMQIGSFQFGLYLNSSSGNSIYGNTITNNSNIYLHLSSDNNITGNYVTNNDYGIGLSYSSNNNIHRNNITHNERNGISLDWSSNNIISENNITHNERNGIWLFVSSNNIIYHNNFVNNTKQVYDFDWDYPHTFPSVNIWDNGKEGNYWSDYNGTDADQDGIGDSPYVIDTNNQGNHPLMGMFYDFTVFVPPYPAGGVEHVTVISNSTVSNLDLLAWLSSPKKYLQLGDKFIQFHVAGEEGSVGFCRVMIPRVVLNDSYIVLVDWQEVPATELPISNSTHAYLYFTYNHSMHEVIIVPEFSKLTLMLLILILLTVTIAIYKRRLLKTPIH